VTAPQLSATHALPTGFGPAAQHVAATPLYDALVHEYRQALRCVPGDQGHDDRAAGGAAPFIPEYGVLPYAARRVSATAGVPRQVSRHRRSPGDMPNPAYY
jgi:hypothetical protein